ncbi:MAG: transcriptional regulator [Treponema sp.]|nr:transcriptional regulator [Treponema sp.]
MAYIEEAVESLKSILLSGKGNILEVLSRASKGEEFALKYLSSKESPALPTELSEALHSSTARISTLLGALEKKGLVVREIDPGNRRNILVTLTDTGREQAALREREMKNRMARVLGELGETDTRELVRLLSRVSGISQKVNPMDLE